MNSESGVLTVPGNLESIPGVRVWLGELLARWSIPEETAADIQSAIMEICTNVVRHGYRADSAGEIRLEVIIQPDRVEIVVADDAPAFTPGREAQLPRRRLAEGGYGIYLVHSLMDQVTYEPLGPTGNRTTLVKRIGPAVKGPANSTEPAAS